MKRGEEKMICVVRAAYRRMKETEHKKDFFMAGKRVLQSESEEL
jgi:hypothetical protein